MMRTIGQAELQGMDLRRVEEPADSAAPGWEERHPALCAVIGVLGIFGMPVVLIAILYAVGKARGM